jgi:hypothetical protein
VDDPCDLESLPLGLDDEGRNTRTPRPAGAREDQAVIGPISPADPQLGAVQDPMIIAVANRAGLDRPRRVASARGLGQAEEHLLFAAQHGIEIFLLLRLGRLEQLSLARAAERPVAGGVEAAAMLRAFNGDQYPRDHVDVRAPIFGRRVQAVEPHRLGLLDQPRENFRLQLVGVGVHALLERQDLLTHEAADHVDDHRLFLGEREVHGWFPS